MNFIDEAKIYIRSGKGGNGCISFRREKFIPKGGPDGGNGGKGGDIIVVTDSNLNTLNKFHSKRHFCAENGENGKGKNRSGKSGQPLIINVPIGTQIFNEQGDTLIVDLVKSEQEYEILKGGKGGLGNSHFRSSTNQTPRHAISGQEGEEIWLWLKLKLLSDIGLIGLPNAGKSTLLSVITRAKPKIASYPFSTLTPNLGVVHMEDNDFVVADIPGLISGAHLGHGLGDRFLKHVERCRALVHLLDATSSSMLKDYLIVRQELRSYSPLLLDKQEIICITKSDVVSGEEIEKNEAELKKELNREIYVISSHNQTGIKKLIFAMFKLVNFN